MLEGRFSVVLVSFPYKPRLAASAAMQPCRSLVVMSSYMVRNCFPISIPISSVVAILCTLNFPAASALGQSVLQILLQERTCQPLRSWKDVYTRCLTPEWVLEPA